MSKEKQYTITCNKEQLQLIAKALEMHSRAICGQIEESFSPPIHDELWKHYNTEKDADNSEYFYKRNKVEEHLLAVKDIIWPGFGPGASNGIGYDETADLGYEMYKCIKSKFEEEREAECLKNDEDYFGNVHTGIPLKLTNIPFIKVEDEDENI